VTAADRVRLIETRLRQAFEPSEIEVFDESHQHVGHPGARDGKGHFRIRIVANGFAGATRLQCHRMVYDVLADLMQTDIHALSVNASATQTSNEH
jgi:BolA protein